MKKERRVEMREHEVFSLLHSFLTMSAEDCRKKGMVEEANIYSSYLKKLDECWQLPEEPAEDEILIEQDIDKELIEMFR